MKVSLKFDGLSAAVAAALLSAALELDKKSGDAVSVASVSDDVAVPVSRVAEPDLLAGLSEGASVAVNGSLYVGSGTVIDTSRNDGDAGWVRSSQAFPQVRVRCGDGRLRHYNGDDLKAGKVKPA